MTAEPSNLVDLERSSSPNDALACPSGVCAAATDFESPYFGVDVESLMSTVREVVSAQPRTEMLREDPVANQLVFEQRTKTLGFKDTIWVQAMKLEAGATLIMYSRSNVGYWDFGVNRHRLRTWLGAIEEAVASPTASAGPDAKS